MTRGDALSIIAADMGFSDVEEMLYEATFDSVAPGLCYSCRATVDNCEPDARANWCDCCHRKTVKSVLVIAGML
jgi:hypothetical protein